MIDPKHPVVRAMAEEMAREVSDAAVLAIKSRAASSFYESEVIATMSLIWSDVIAAHARLLTDFARPATRDVWIRWGRKFALDAVLSGDPDRIRRDGPSVVRWGEHLRDNPEALEAAVCAALETMS